MKVKIKLFIIDSYLGDYFNGAKPFIFNIYCTERLNRYFIYFITNG